MVEAKGEPTAHVTKTLTAGEIENLADRLLAHAVSTVALGGEPQMKANLRTASHVLRGLLGKLQEWNRTVSVHRMETDRLLSDIRIEVEG